MTYVNAVKYLSAHNQGVPSPERMRLLCRYLGDPQRQMRFIHIAGGSGKTSCAVMLSVMLTESKYKIGSLTSPYVREHRECVAINNAPLPHKEFAGYIEIVSAAAQKMKSDIDAAAHQVDEQPIEPENEQLQPRHPKITKNLLEGRISPEPVMQEIICAAAFLAFHEHDCNIVILECGESRADPTGIIEPPLVAVICGNVFSDEQLRTGTGIIRRGTREVVCLAPAGESYSAILDSCVRTGSRLTVPARAELKLIRSALGGKTFEYRGKTYSIPYCAEYQLRNALIAIETVYALRRTGVALHSEDVARGISQARLPLRFEIFAVSPAVIIDSPQSQSDAQALCESLKSISRLIGNKLILVNPTGYEIVTKDALESNGFSVSAVHTPETESDDKAIAARTATINSEETMLILGPPSFTGRIKTALQHFMAYR